MATIIQPTLFDRFIFESRIESLMKENEESIDIEFKSAKGGFPGSFWETYSSFANTQGGTIVFGVKEKDGKFFIDKLTEKDIKTYQKIFWDTVNNKLKVNRNLLSSEDVVAGEFEGSWLLIFNIPRAGRSQRPIYLDNNPDNTYKRNHEGDYKCSLEEIRRMYADSDIDHPKDSRILEGFSIEEDIDKDSLNQYRNLLHSVKEGHPWLALDDRDLLIKLGGYRRDRKDNIEGLTLAGLLMFGKYDSIHDPNACPAYFPDYKEYLSSNVYDRWTNRIYPDGTWEANLFQFYLRVFPKLAMALPRPFVLKNGTRTENTPAHISLREAFVNTLIHCDYTVDSNISIELHKDRLVFSNPGSLLISLHQYYQGGESVCRNKSLQQMFMMLGGAEKAGSGVDKILSGWKETNFRSPKVEEKYQPDKVVLELPLVSLLSDEIMYHLKKEFGDDVISIGHEKLLALATCYSEGEVTNFRLQLVTYRSSSEITLLLKELCNEGYLISSGIGRGTRYRLNPEYRVLPDNVASNVASNVVSNVASKSYKRTRVSADRLYASIIDFCTEYRSQEEIAIHIHKSLLYLKNNVIPKMISMGLLTRKHSSPRHPDQQYIATQHRKG